MQRYEKRMRGISLDKAGSGVIYCSGHSAASVKETAVRIAREADETIAAKDAKIESLESKCAKMRELLGECRPYMGEVDDMMTGELVAKIDVILENQNEPD